MIFTPSSDEHDEANTTANRLRALRNSLRERYGTPDGDYRFVVACAHDERNEAAKHAADAAITDAIDRGELTDADDGRIAEHIITLVESDEQQHDTVDHNDNHPR